jgi:hypothetical protein
VYEEWELKELARQRRERALEDGFDMRTRRIESRKQYKRRHKYNGKLGEFK